MVAAFRWSRSGRLGWRSDRARGDDAHWTLSIPAKVEGDGRVNAEVDYAANITLKPGESLLHSTQFLSPFTAAISTSRCGSGQVCCRKKDGISPSRRTKPIT